MPFNSLSFVYFLLAFAGVYYSSGSRRGPLIILLGSYTFYAFFNLKSLLLLLTTTVITYYAAKRTTKTRGSRTPTFVAITLIVLQLLVVKYTTLFGFLDLVHTEREYLANTLMAIGISFYSLQAVSLLVDVRTGRYTNEISLTDVAQYLAFFPQSYAGPIHRANELIPQFSNNVKFKAEDLFLGFKIIVWGYVCKLIVADKISVVISPIFNSYVDQDGLSLTVAMLLYSFQIYFDFWGYSLIAMGVGRVLGFRINTNFISPYSANSFRSFWHRWHITLSTWMRDYIYIPLGGNKKGTSMFCLSLMLTFIISGFWHGVSFNFLIWGVVHGLFYLTEHFIRTFIPAPKTIGNRYINRTVKIIWRLLFFVLISGTWLIFRTQNTTELFVILDKCGSPLTWSLRSVVEHYLRIDNFVYIAFLGLALSLGYGHATFLTQEVPKNTRRLAIDSCFVCGCLVLLFLWGDIGGQEFVYFKF